MEDPHDIEELFGTFEPESDSRQSSAADGKFLLEEGKDQGDEGDLWHAGSVLKELKPGQDAFPNTDSYRDGEVNPTGIRVYDFSDNGITMTFKVEGVTARTTGFRLTSYLRMFF